MPLHDIANRAELRMQRALRGWARGFPHDETALLNRLWESYAATPFCRYATPFGWTSIATQLVPLHRQGHGARRYADRYGSDLAITVRVATRIPNGNVLNHMKTAFFQFKTANGRFHVKLEAQQIQDASSAPAIRRRSYVLAASPLVKRAAIGKLADLPSIPHGRKTKLVSANSWWSSREWTYQWLSCAEGPMSPLNGSGIEQVLSRFALGPPPQLVWDTIRGDRPGEQYTLARDEDAELPPDLAPSKAWLVHAIIDESLLA